VSEQESTPVFVHSKLDEQGLSPSQFRVYCHLSRRAGNTKAYAGIASMAKLTKLHPDTVRSCLKALERLSMVRREDRQGETSLYTLTPMEEWKHPETEGGDTPGKAMEGRGPKRREGSPGKAMEAHPPETDGGKGNPIEGAPLEGNPLKVIPEENPLLGETPNFPAVILEHLNTATGRRFQPVPKSLKEMEARLAEVGHDVAGVKRMIDRQCSKWKGTDYEEYLRPSTLFRAGKFPEYYANRELPVTNSPNKKPTIEKDYEKGF
jgi:uncharacterized phage protein (TIGR02220 family)